MKTRVPITSLERTPHEETQLALYAAASNFAASGYATEAHRITLEKAAVSFVRARDAAKVRKYGETANARRRILAQRKACGC